MDSRQIEEAYLKLECVREAGKLVTALINHHVQLDVITLSSAIFNFVSGKENGNGKAEPSEERRN